MLANQARLHDIPIPSGLSEAQHLQAVHLLDQAFLTGFRSIMLACAVSAWPGALAVLLLLSRRPAEMHSPGGTAELSPERSPGYTRAT
jgi:hypothetical protein